MDIKLKNQKYTVVSIVGSSPNVAHQVVTLSRLFQGNIVNGSLYTFEPDEAELAAKALMSYAAQSKASPEERVGYEKHRDDVIAAFGAFDPSKNPEALLFLDWRAMSTKVICECTEDVGCPSLFCPKYASCMAAAETEE